MPLHSKHRTSLLMLPIVIALGFFIALKVVEWRQSIRVAQLFDLVAHGEAREAVLAVDELAVMASPPLGSLVSAAVSENREVAGIAKAAINRLLRRWQRDVESSSRAAAIRDQLSEFAKSLGEAVKNKQLGGDECAPTRWQMTDTNVSLDKSKLLKTDHAWFVSTIRKMLRIASELPPNETPLIALYCDTILAAIGPGDFQEKPEALPGAGAFDELTTSASASLPTLGAKDSPIEVQKRFGPDAAVKAAEVPPAAYSPPLLAEPLVIIDKAPKRLLDSAHANELRIGANKLADAGVKDQPTSRTAQPPHLSGSSPIFRILPAVPAASSSKGTNPDRMQNDSRRAVDGAVGDVNRLETAATKNLLDMWLKSEGSEEQTLASELSRRGFGKLSKSVVKQYFSRDPQDRIRLVDQALSQRGGSAEAWLLLLTEDSDADVRLFAVTFMATSNNPLLMEKAWEIAIRDHDPRISDLASRLRERRDGPIRR